MRVFMKGGPIEGPAVRDDLGGLEIHRPIYDYLGFSPYYHIWVPEAETRMHPKIGEHRVYNYVGMLYRDEAVRPRRKDLAIAELQLKWWKVEDLMAELGLELEVEVEGHEVDGWTLSVQSTDAWLPVASKECW